MKCPTCGNELRIASEQVSVDTNGLPEFHRIAYCDTCMTKEDIDAKPIEPVAPQPRVYKDITINQEPEDPYKGYGQYDKIRQKPKEVEHFDAAPDDMQAQLAQRELKALNKNVDSKNKSQVLTVILVILAIGSFLAEAYFGCIFFMIVAIVYSISMKNKRRRKYELEHIANGNKIVNICPKCKSENIEMHMVEKSSYTTHDRSRVSNNINPLHPFTHTNVKMGSDHTSVSYGNQCHCLDCGFVFARPEVHYI